MISSGSNQSNQLSEASSPLLYDQFLQELYWDPIIPKDNQKLSVPLINNWKLANNSHWHHPTLAFNEKLQLKMIKKDYNIKRLDLQKQIVEEATRQQDLRYDYQQAQNMKFDGYISQKKQFPQQNQESTQQYFSSLDRSSIQIDQPQVNTALSNILVYQGPEQMQTQIASNFYPSTHQSSVSSYFLREQMIRDYSYLQRIQ